MKKEVTSSHKKAPKSTKLVKRTELKPALKSSQPFCLMSSWEIAQLLDVEHDEILEFIDVATDPWTKRDEYKLVLNINEFGNEERGYHFDLKALLGFAHHLTALGGDGAAEETIIQEIETFMIKSLEIISKSNDTAETVLDLYNNRCNECIYIDALNLYEKRCEECSYQKALNSLTTVLILKNEEIEELRAQREVRK